MNSYPTFSLPVYNKNLTDFYGNRIIVGNYSCSRTVGEELKSSTLYLRLQEQDTPISTDFTGWIRGSFEWSHRKRNQNPKHKMTHKARTLFFLEKRLITTSTKQQRWSNIDAPSNYLEHNFMWKQSCSLPPFSYSTHWLTNSAEHYPDYIPWATAQIGLAMQEIAV